MKTIKETGFILACLLLMSGCQRQRQVWLGALQRTHNASPDVTRAYFDKRGNVYPRHPVFIPYKDYFDPQNGRRTNSEKFVSGNLEEYFRSKSYSLQQAYTAYGLNGGKNFTDSFSILQTAIITSYAETLTKRIEKSKSKTLIVLIHGFNDPDPTGDYQQLREYIQSKKDPSKDHVYLELYWDGLTCNQGNPAFARIWAKAQANSARTSITLRKILTNISSDTKIRIITHSMGAGVATGALFNTASKWKGVPPADYHSANTPGHSDIRLGMIAPAIPGENTFRDFKYRNRDTIQPQNNNLSKIIVGFNSNDYALTKLIYISGKFGATSLGCNRKGIEFRNARRQLIDFFGSVSVVDSLFKAVDFTQKKKWNPEEHGLYYYMLNSPCIETFVNELFN